MSFKLSSSNNKSQSSVLLGLLLAIAGIFYMLKQFGLVHINIHFWPLFIIAAGIMSGLRRGFNRPTPIILMFIGIVFLVPKFTIAGVASSKLIWPTVLIASGLYIIFRSRQKDALVNAERQKYQLDVAENNPNYDYSQQKSSQTTSNGNLNIEAYFGGRKEIITSKQFSGCSATAICGGAEINLMQADSTIQPMVIDLRVLFGGIEIIVPSHWEIINEVDVLFGGIEDKRNLRTATEIGEGKKLILRGSVSFGGLELKSY